MALSIYHSPHLFFLLLLFVHCTISTTLNLRVNVHDTRHGIAPRVPPRDHHNDPEIEEILVRPYFPVRPADYQSYSYTFWFSASYRAYVYHNGVYLGYSNDPYTHEVVSGHAGRGDVFSVVARARHGNTGVIAAISVGPYDMATGIPRGNGFKVASRSEMERDGLNWKLKEQKSCFWQTDPVVLPDSSTNVLRSKNFPFEKTAAKYVWAPGREDEADGYIWLRYVVGGAPCQLLSSVSSGTETCDCIESDSPEKGDCYDFTMEESKILFDIERRCEKRDCGPKYECVQQKTNMVCVRKFITSEIHKATPVFNGKCIQVRISPKPIYFPYH